MIFNSQFHDLHIRWDDSGEGASLEDFTSLAATGCQFVFTGVEALLTAHGGLDRHGVAVIHSGGKADHVIVLGNLDQLHTLGWTGDEVDFLGVAQQGAGAEGCDEGSRDAL